MTSEAANRGNEILAALRDGSLPDHEGGAMLEEAIGFMRSLDGEGLGSDDVEAFDIIAAEEQVYHHVRSGDVAALLRMGVPAASVPPEGVGTAEHLRSLLVVLNAICLHAALDGGVSKRVAYGLNRTFSQRIQACAEEDEIDGLAASKVIPLSYCLLVRELTVPDVTDKDAVRAIRYIHDHIHERIAVSDVAEHIGLSTEYFSAKFKCATGMTVSTYISRTRVKEAEALLRFTDLSIGEIAAQLSYSSQSHFQSAFKRETGTTPQQYRTASAEGVLGAGR